MTYQVLARKYRPRNFEELVGQAHVATTLKNALRQQKVSHAYLFSGPRGVGKTTTARILAKALNCVKGPTATPCNACDSCQRIAQGQEMVDVLEIDAASNRGIEEIRELRENVRYAPARSRFKVYIVDEAHQITHDAFNAFLKTLEEPPEHAVFVLATTEYQKIPATILSRCQLFRFKRVSEDDIAARLRHILSEEKIAVEDGAIARLARAAGGSVRDSLSLLDQALAFVGSDPATTRGLTPAVTAKQVEMLMGFLPEEFLVGFASAILERTPDGVLQWIRQLVDEGWEIPQFVRDFREYVRLAMVEQLSRSSKSGGAATPKDAAPAGKSVMLAGRSVSLPEILYLLRSMGQCLDEMRWNDNPRLVLEMHSLRLTQPFMDAGELLRKIEALQNGSTKDSGLRAEEPKKAGTENPGLRTEPPKTVSSLPPQRAPAPVSPPRTPSLPEKTVPPAANSSPSLSPQSSVLGPAVDPVQLWKQLLAELWKKPTVAAHMERAYLKSATPKEWVVSFADKFAMDSVLRAQTFVQESLLKVTGQPVGLRCIQESRERRETDPMVIAVPPAEEQVSAAVQDAQVQKVLQVFRGKIRPADADSD